MKNSRITGIRVKMEDRQANVFWWTVRHVANATQCGVTTNSPLKHHRQVTGWSYTDHEGCERFSEGTWMDLVHALRRTACNYDFTTSIS